MEKVMGQRLSRTILITLCVCLAGAALVIRDATAAVDGIYFFTGEAEDQVNKAAESPTATFSKEQPDGSDITQTGHPNCNSDVAGNPLCIYWTGPYAGEIDGPVDFCWYWSTNNGVALAVASIDLEVTLFADAVAGEESPDAIIARQEVAVPAAPNPTQVVSTIDVQGGKVTDSLLIQVRPIFADTGPGTTVHYGSEDTLSAFGPPGQACVTGGASPSGTSTGGPSPSASPGGEKGPGVKMRFTDPTPERGAITKAKTKLKNCEGHERTNIQLQSKRRGRFVLAKQKKLNGKCKATFKVKATFDERTFRAQWPKQDADHRRGRSKPVKVKTH